jgi:cysteinyl-tRNA synthetase
VDHIPIHHENEIAQSEAFLGKPAVNYWAHGEFLLVDNGKMSKSLGNTYRIDDLKAKGFNPLAYRYFCLNAVYRNKLNFTWEGLQSAQTALDRLYEGALAHKNGTDEVEPGAIQVFRMEFEEAINDDLNIPKALSTVWGIIRNPKKSKALFQLLVEMDEILGLDIDKVEKKKEDTDPVSDEIQKLIEERQKARKEKNWALSDKIRDDLKAQGIILEDSPEGVKWKRV